MHAVAVPHVTFRAQHAFVIPLWLKLLLLKSPVWLLLLVHPRQESEQKTCATNSNHASRYLGTVLTQLLQQSGL